MGDLANHAIGSIFLLILVFLIVKNYQGFTAIMKQGGATTSDVSKTLQGR